MTHVYHLQTPRTRHTIRSKDHAVTLFLTDDYQLRIKLAQSRHAYFLEAVSVLQLINMLADEYKAIVTEARKHNGIGRGGNYAYDDLS